MLENCNSLLKRALNNKKMLKNQKIKRADKTSRFFLFLLIQVAQE
jgi:hypothetical protein